MLRLLIFLLFTCPIAHADFFDFLLDKNAASEEDVVNKICISSVETILNKHHYLIDKINLGVKTRNFRFNSLVLENQNKKSLKVLEDLVGYNQKYLGQTQCKNTDCIFLNLFPRKNFSLIRYIYLKYNIITSHYIDNEAQAWSYKDLKTIILALENLPQHLLPLKKTFKILRHKENSEPYGMHEIIGVSNNLGDIRFFNYYDRISDAKKIYALTHEIAHTIGMSLSLEGGKEWSKLSREEKAISSYGKKSQIEDFAESFSAYRYNPDFLLKRSPKKYAFFKELLFFGVEYLSRNCSNKNHYYSQLINKTPIKSDSLIDICDFEVLGYELGRKKLPEVLSCFENNYHSVEINIPFEKNIHASKYHSLIKRLFQDYSFPHFDLSQKRLKFLWRNIERFETYL